MKKEMVFVCVALLSGVVHAKESLDLEKLEEIKNNATTITYTFSISRSQYCDEEAWGKLVDLAAGVAKVGIASDNGNASNEEVVQETTRSLRETLGQCGGKDGIEGSFSVRFDDGSKKGCDGVCGGEPKDDK